MPACGLLARAPDGFPGRPQRDCLGRARPGCPAFGRALPGGVCRRSRPRLPGGAGPGPPGFRANRVLGARDWL